MRKDFFRLLERVHDNRKFFTSFSIMSNGSTINANIAKKLKSLGISAVQISLDGMEGENDRTRGRGNFKKAINGINKLIENELPVGVSVTVHKGNIKDVPRLIELCEQLGVKSIGISRLVPLGRGQYLNMLDPSELRDFYRYLMNLKVRGNGIFVANHCSDSLWFIEDSKHETHGCSTGYDSFSILPNGDIVPCRRLPIKVGNVLEKTLFEIWYTSKTLWDIRNKNNVNIKCRNCEIFDNCYGGAKCVTYGYFKDPSAPDPQCWKLFKTLPKVRKFPSGEEKMYLVDKYVEDFDPEMYFIKMGYKERI